MKNNQQQKKNIFVYFQDYRASNLHLLPFHDVAVHLNYRYAGGLAFVGGICTSKSIMIAGVSGGGGCDDDDETQRLCFCALEAFDF